MKKSRRSTRSHPKGAFGNKIRRRAKFMRRGKLGSSKRYNPL